MEPVETAKNAIAAFINDMPSSDLKELLQNCVDKLEEYNSLDHDFIGQLKDLAEFDHTEIHDHSVYSELSNEISAESTVIYFKTAITIGAMVFGIIAYFMIKIVK